ncbi:MAG: chromosome segregation protein SMC [Pseudomonadota bacterium]
MRLKTIKLSGFKSFVDPTTFHLPSHLIGVVGPNGCGKSNIIDAVRWVMGESSPRLLRGDSMSDVIFNGSNARKPVGQATVELLFDNSEGKLTGEYASFAEISVRRTVSREGQSQYFLNGTRCRRRDITDLFLGTGLGPRSYSIIEQGMISQLVEARPEELRHHLEEAAGISRYKERRRETENRIRHTRENLSRLDDLREEVDKQLRTLDRQAKQAERYKTLKAEQRQGEAELLALNCVNAREAQARAASELAAGNNALESRNARVTALEADLEAGRAAQSEAFEAVNEVQGQLYEVGAEIARLEQAIAHRKELKQQQVAEQKELADNVQSLRETLDLDRVHVAELTREIGELEPALETSRRLENEAMDRAQETEQALAAWQNQWDEHSQDTSERNREADVERTRIGHLDQQLLDRTAQLKRLAEEQETVDLDELEAELNSQESQRETLSEQARALETQLEALRDGTAERTQQLRELEDQLTESREALDAARSRHASLTALQQAAQSLDAALTPQWLAEQGLKDSPRAAAQIAVSARWEQAAEHVLGPFLDSFVVDQLGAGVPALRSLAEGRLGLLAAGSGGEGPSGTLAAELSGPPAVLALASQVLLAGDLAEALSRADSLAPGQSLLTPEGEWVGPGWVAARRPAQGEEGVIAREREIGALAEQLKREEQRIEQLLEQKKTFGLQLDDLQAQRDEKAQELAARNRAAAEAGGRADGIRARLLHLKERQQRITAESEELKSRIETDESAVREARSRLQGNVDAMANLESRRGELSSSRDEARSNYDEARVAANRARQSAHELALSLESKRSALKSTEQSLERSETQINALNARAEELLRQVEASGEPMAADEAALQQQLEGRRSVEQQLAERRKTADEHAVQLQQLDQQRREAVDAQTAAREKLEQLKLEQEGSRVRLEGLLEQLKAAGYELEPLLEGMATDQDPVALAAALEKLSTRIQRMEPVNLAAIEQFEEQSERKKYLDDQNEDLNRALTTLEDAIRKIDKETRTRFKETFDQVNDGLKALFPRLFGGGHGYMELVGDDLLTSGVAIMARPPGKRVSNIHLLSGGEKALTAVALVFAIFQLNPAPFCMLDEVDAPLDDANVGRFSELVKQMSEQVQFLFVTHNKITMEAAHQLLGVTMAEAGVSRLVSVDIAEATRMVEA